MFSRVLLACLLLPCLPALELEPAISLPPPTIKLPPQEQPVVLERYALALAVRGLHAQCTATMVFRNPNPRPLEGTLEFPLADQAAVCGYALDIGGRMVDGVVVGRDRARVALEAETRQRVDPGLVEQVRGNIFRTRIFPIPAQGTRQIAVTWVEELAVRGEAAALRVPLPHVLLPTLELKVEITSGEVEPELGGFGNLTLTRWRDQRVAEARLADATPGDDLLVRLPHLPGTLVVVEEDRGERFAAISAAAPTRLMERSEPPRRIAVAWDASGSRTPEGVARGKAFLAALLAAWPGCLVDLVVFRDVPQAPQVCRNREELGDALDRAVCDGGTALSRLDLRRAALPHQDDACWVVVSDGLETLGEGLPGCGDVPVHAALAESVRDAALLRLVAGRSGGTLVDLLAADAPSAAAALARPSPCLMRVEAASTVLSEVQCATSQGRGLVTARLLGDGPVALVFGLGGREQARITVELRVAAAVPGAILAKAWAAARAADLGVFPETNRAELIALGQRYHLVTPGTSLMVLENLEQYWRHRIEPPTTQPELLRQYLVRLKTQGERFQAEDGRHLQRVIAWWEERVRWWQHPPAVPAAKPAPVPAAAAVEAATAAAAATTPEIRTTTIDAPLAAGRAAVQSPSPGAVDASRLEVEADTSPSAPPRGREKAVGASEHGGTGVFMAIGAGGGAGGTYGSRHAGSVRHEALKAKEAEAPASGSIAITPFDPATPYLRSIKAAPADQAYAAYLRERPAYRSSPSFFLDCASALLPIDAALGRRVLSNLAELRLDDTALLRVFAWRLEQAGDADLAIAILRKVLRLRPEEPQSSRDLALALAARGAAAGRGADLTEAMDLLYRVVMRQPILGADLGEPEVLEQAWNRFPQVEVIALEELNRLLAVIGRRSWDQAPVQPPLEARLRRLLDCDLRVVMGWDADATDIDLHVLEPSGEEACYNHNRTSSGGLVSCDMTQGYGPEEYLIRSGAPGTYRIRCHYFGARAQTLFGPATVTAMAITDWGRANERRQMMTLRLDRQGEVVGVGAITLGSAASAVSATSAAGANITREQVRTLKAGMDRAAVERLLGMPARVDGGGLTVLVYTTVQGTTVRLGFGPELLWAREVLDGAERDLL